MVPSGLSILWDICSVLCGISVLWAVRWTEACAGRWFHRGFSMVSSAVEFLFLEEDGR